MSAAKVFVTCFEEEELYLFCSRAEISGIPFARDILIPACIALCVGGEMEQPWPMAFSQQCHELNSTEQPAMSWKMFN